MSLHPEPSLEELLWTVAAARIVLGPAMNVQAPPNLTPPSEQLQQVGSAGSSETIRASEEEAQVAGLRQGWRALLDAGINDWGGSVGLELGRRIVGLGSGPAIPASGRPRLRPTLPVAFYYARAPFLRIARTNPVHVCRWHLARDT